MLPINPHPPSGGREKGSKGREAFKLNIKTALLITLIIQITLIIREIIQNIQNILSFPELGAGVPAAAGQHQAVPDWTRQWAGTGLRNARISILIRIAGRTTSRVLFRRRPWMKRARPLWSPALN